MVIVICTIFVPIKPFSDSYGLYEACAFVLYTFSISFTFNLIVTCLYIFVFKLLHIFVHLQESTCSFVQIDSQIISICYIIFLPVHHLFNFLSNISFSSMLCLISCLRDCLSLALTLFISLPLISVQCTDRIAGCPSPW